MIPIKSDDIYKIIRDHKKQSGIGIEAIIIHPNDLLTLLSNVHASKPVRHCCAEGKETFKLFGIKIVPNEYIEQGTILKVMEQDQLFALDHEPWMTTMPNNAMEPKSYYDMSQFQQWPKTTTVNGSGIIPGLEHLVKTPPIVDDVKIEKEKKKPERKHSTARKIELD